MVLRHALLPSLAGPLLAIASTEGLHVLRVLPEAHAYRPLLARLIPALANNDTTLEEDPQAFRPLAVQLGEYFAGLRRTFDLPLSPHGTPFQKAVWQCIAMIPYGKLRSYGELAEQLGRPRAARAVGKAAAQNPLSLLIPCHRVIGSDGGLVGFASGTDLKARLLRLEGHTLAGARRVAPPRLF